MATNALCDESSIVKFIVLLKEYVYAKISSLIIK